MRTRSRKNRTHGRCAEEIVDRVTKIAIRLMRESYGQCMKENIIELLKYLKFELETVNENT